ncbi:hypothetical protein [Streptomyces griseorubiginosus]|uniref:hypothetical protein n=1 Tax=Streptomyces griseorubiginosus TaxID=67304 RepID=UPI00131CFCBD|nr:hypothetical protein [Streptomyces griseorubiginosus]
MTSWPEEAWQPVKLATTTNDHRKTNPTVKPGKPAIEEQAPADELSPLIFSAWDPGRRNVTRYDSEDAARAAALKHARCEAYACFPRGRGAGLARLEVQAPTDREDSDWLAPHDLPADD